MTERVSGRAAEEFAALLGDLAADRVATGWLAIDTGHVPTLTAAETEIVTRAVPGRRAEFATGRALLRSLIGEDVEVLRSANGAPVLPDGVTGSLAHDRELAVAAVGSSSAIRAVGIDVEPIHRLSDPVAELVVRSDDVVPDAITAFVAKEAAYKTWSILGGGILEHHDVNVIVEGGCYSADLAGAMTVRGSIGRAADRVVALAIIPAT